MHKWSLSALPSFLESGEKNDQILMSSNWFGGTQDPRPDWRNSKLYLDDIKMFTYDSLNVINKTAVGTPGKHYYDDFDLQMDQLLLPRVDYCHNIADSDTSMTSTSGLDVSNPLNLS